MIIQSIILGIIQGLTEFLPISSSAHLVLIRKFFNWSDFGLSYDIALHIGTLIAIAIFFRKDWANLISSFFSSLFKFKINSNEEKLSWIIVFASIISAIGAYFLEAKAETTFRNPLLIAFTLIFFGAVLFLADLLFANKKSIEKISFKEGLMVGIAQILAVIPGVSRSGITISAARILKIDRESAVKFSFLLSAPMIFGAAFSHLNDFKSLFNTYFLIGILSSMFSGYLAIKILMSFIKKNNFFYFFIYRLLLGLAIILFIFK